VANVPSDEEFLAYNQGVISEFRTNHGVVSQPPFPILLLTTTGARTGRAWFHNLRANPSVTVELGDRTYPARAVVTEGDERDRLYAMISDGAGEYEKNTDRVFPVIVLDGVPAPV
jgi:hypothetical protein